MQLLSEDAMDRAAIIEPTEPYHPNYLLVDTLTVCVCVCVCALYIVQFHCKPVNFHLVNNHILLFSSPA